MPRRGPPRPLQWTQRYRTTTMLVGKRYPSDLGGIVVLMHIVLTIWIRLSGLPCPRKSVEVNMRNGRPKILMPPKRLIGLLLTISVQRRILGLTAL